MYCRVGRACDVSECARVQRALGVCVLWCMWSHTSFLARGEIARPSPLAERSSCYTPTLRVDTHPPQEETTYTYAAHFLSCLSSTDLSGRRGQPRILGLHCSAQSTYAPPLGCLLDPELRGSEKLRG